MSYKDELRAIAQNDYMVDGHYLPNGELLNRIADSMERDAKADDWIEEVGDSVYRSVESLVAALECDYDRLEELKEVRREYDEEGRAKDADEFNPFDTWAQTGYAEEFAKLIEAAGECESRDDAEERIHEDALSVEVRSGWYEPSGDKPAPEEFNILLCTGGPAARIRGELDEYSEPTRAWLEVQDWGKPWTQYLKADQDVLLTYARCFYYGEG